MLKMKLFPLTLFSWVRRELCYTIMLLYQTIGPRQRYLTALSAALTADIFTNSKKVLLYCLLNSAILLSTVKFTNKILHSVNLKKNIIIIINIITIIHCYSKAVNSCIP